MRKKNRIINEKKGVEREKSLSKSVYLSDGYFDSWQWQSFLFQIKKIRQIMTRGKYSSILEIGRGSGFVNAILNELGYETDSLDININLNPTYVGNISVGNIDIGKKYDLVLCAEVLEHIPFDKLDNCLKNIRNLTRDVALITLPNCKGPCRATFSINSRNIDFLIRRWRKSKISKGHFWEINYADYCTNELITCHMAEFFDVIEEGVVEQYPYHYFYVLYPRA